jgi:O-antigen ligase
MKKSRIVQNSCIFCAGASTVLFLIGWLNDTTLFMLIGCIFVFIPLLFADDVSLFSLIFFYIPNIRMFKLSGGSSMTVIGFFTVAFLLRIVLASKLKINSKVIQYLLLYWATVFISMIINQNLSQLLPLIRYSIDIMLFFSLCILYKSQLFSFFIKLKNYFLAGTLSALTCGIIFQLINQTNIQDIRFAGVNNDPNYYGVIMATAFSVVILSIVGRFTKKITPSIFLAMLILIGGLLSLSRGFVIALSINILLILYLLFSRKTFNMKQKGWIVFIVILLIIFTSGLLNDYFMTIFNRFIEDESGGGRIEIWAQYLLIISSNYKTFLFGLGSSTRIWEQGIIMFVPHNTIIDIFVAFGILGIISTILLYISFVFVLKDLTGINKFNKIGFCPFISLLLGYSFLSGIHSDSFIFLSLFTLFMCALFSAKRNTKADLTFL